MSNQQYLNFSSGSILSMDKYPIFLIKHTIWAGVNYAIEWVNNLHFTEDDLAEIS